MMRKSNLISPAGFLLACLTLFGCSTLPQTSGPVQPAKLPISEFVKPGVAYPIDVYDPWESFNRGMYTFNAGFDEYVFLPVVHFYEAVTPDFVEDRVSNFFSNISDIRNLLNAIFQLKGQQAAQTLARLVYNTTFGILGLWDPATAMGLPQQREDFGLTLGYYGVSPGPYLVLPLFGPSNLRDTAGLVTDSLAFSTIDPLRLNNHPEREITYFTLDAIETRQKIQFRYYETGSPFEYSQMRFLYNRLRQIEIGVRKPEEEL
ncbi:MAG TPA: VacJ family lipoprotein [Saprospiraceae bacterium]|nr:VacJ family lipoprotein [Saprospiraceae bacterium]